MNLAVWAERDGVARGSAYRWFRAGLLPVGALRVGRLILVDEPTGDAGLRRRSAVYARVSSAEVDVDLVRDMAEILTSMCARLCGKRGAHSRAKRAVAAAVADDREVA